MKLVITIDLDENNIVNKQINIPEKKDLENSPSEYARYFDETSALWTKSPEFNLNLLKSQQNYMNDKLRAKGYLFLNEAYEMLGMPKTKVGQVVGWIYDEQNPIGDNYVDLGLYDIKDEVNVEFINGNINKVLINPNVDGYILDYIKD